MRIVQKHLPDIEEQLATSLVKAVHLLREPKLDKTPGIAETLDWASGLLALGYKQLNEESVAKSLGCILKSRDDIESIKNQGIEAILEEALP